MFLSTLFKPDGVRTRGQFGIGEGRLTDKEKLLNLECSLDDIEEGGHVGDSFWSSLDSSEKEKETPVAEEEDEEQHDNDMLYCSTMGCTESFRTIRWLSEHERKGVHIIVNKYERGWALKASHTTYGLDKEAKELAEDYFRTQRALIPPRRAYPAIMKKKLEDAKDPSDPTGNRYLLHYSQVPSEKQLKSLFSRLESSRLIGPKKTSAPSAKTPKMTPKKTTAPAAKTPKKIATTPIKKNPELKPSVRTPIDGKRKRKIVQESDESEQSDESDEFEESNESEKKEGTDAEGAEDEQYEEEEILGEQEDDFAKRIIEEECKEIYL